MKARCRILYVDDHEDSGEMLRLLLSPMNYEVESAHTAEQAIKMAQAGKFDLYVLDKRLPDGSGVDLCQKLHQLTPSIPCIFYTGDTYETHRAQAVAAGADAYVAKPDVEKLIETVNQFLSQSECATA
jgi:CheY-like chemotaxis protein